MRKRISADTAVFLLTAAAAVTWLVASLYLGFHSGRITVGLLLVGALAFTLLAYGSALQRRPEGLWFWLAVSAAMTVGAGFLAGWEGGLVWLAPFAAWSVFLGVGGWLTGLARREAARRVRAVEATRAAERAERVASQVEAEQSGLVCRWRAERTNVYTLVEHNLDRETETQRAASGAYGLPSFLLAQRSRHAGSHVGCAECEALIEAHIREELRGALLNSDVQVGYELDDGFRHTFA